MWLLLLACLLLIVFASAQTYLFEPETTKGDLWVTLATIAFAVALGVVFFA
jgi:hypothetical protein